MIRIAAVNYLDDFNLRRFNIVPAFYRQKYTLLSHRENLKPDGRKSLRLLLKANRRLNTAYILKEEFSKLWDYEREGWARRFFEN